MQKKLETIAEYYGYDVQTRQLFEEMGELIQAINKFYRKQLKRGKVELHNVPFGTKEEENIIEELADVEVMTAQIKHLLNCKKAVEKVKAHKINRTLEEIAKEESKNV